jgi:hypothetical protein
MKILLISCLVFLTALTTTQAQTADDYVAQGRAFLVAHDLTNANTSFAAALALSPAHPTANVLRATTRLLLLPDQPAGAALLDQLGFSQTDRSLYNWTATVPRDIHGFPVAPTGMSATALTSFLRTNVVDAFIDSEVNLAAVTDTNFTLTLTSAETDGAGVTLDYGDVLLSRAGLEFAEYLTYTIDSWNVNVQLTAIRSLFVDTPTTAQAFLAQYPTLFTFATTNDLLAARLAFINGAADYQAASDFIRQRPPGIVRLFNLDPSKAGSEAKFRTTLNELVQSLNGPVVLTLNSNLTICMAPLFSGQNPPRAFFPQFSGDAIIAGTLPDPTFGGVLGGSSEYQMEYRLRGKVHVVSHFVEPQPVAGGGVLIALKGLQNSVVEIQRSSDLYTWNTATLALIQAGSFTFTDTNRFASNRLFYRAIERPDALSVAGQAVDVSTAQALPNVTAILSFPSDPTMTPLTNRTDAGGHFVLISAVRPPSGDYRLTVSAAGYVSSIFDGYYSDDQHAYRHVYVQPFGYVPPNDNFAQRQILTGTNPSATGFNIGATKEAGEPNHAGNTGGKSVWWTWTAPENGVVTIDTSGSVFDTVMGVYTGTSVSALAFVASDDDNGNGLTSKVTFSATAGTAYAIAVDGYGGDSGRITLNLHYTSSGP